jgi:hypothetical protein
VWLPYVLKPRHLKYPPSQDIGTDVGRPCRGNPCRRTKAGRAKLSTWSSWGRVTSRFLMGMKVERTSGVGGRGGGVVPCGHRRGGEREGITAHPGDQRGHGAPAHIMAAAHHARPQVPLARRMRFPYLITGGDFFAFWSFFKEKLYLDPKNFNVIFGPFDRRHSLWRRGNTGRRHRLWRRGT